MRIALLFLLVAMFACAGAGLYGLFAGKLPADKLLSTASSLAAIASLTQLSVSGWFTRILEQYGDQTKFPYGPPSHITRQIIDNPDDPVGMWFRNFAFNDPATGAKLAVVSAVLAIVATWAK